MKNKITAIIMASGFSRRMGQNKLLMTYKNKYIIENVFEEINKVNFLDIVVISQYEEVLELAKKYDFKGIYNENPQLEQSESIKLGVLNSSKCEGFMFFVGDQPLINYKDINTMIKEFNNDRSYIVIPKYKETKGNPVIFPYDKKQELLDLKENEKGKDIIKRNKKKKYIDVSQHMLFDIDTIDDFNKLLSL